MLYPWRVTNPGRCRVMSLTCPTTLPLAKPSPVLHTDRLMICVELVECLRCQSRSQPKMEIISITWNIILMIYSLILLNYARLCWVPNGEPLWIAASLNMRSTLLHTRSHWTYAGLHHGSADACSHYPSMVIATSVTSCCCCCDSPAALLPVSYTHLTLPTKRIV